MQDRGRWTHCGSPTVSTLSYFSYVAPAQEHLSGAIPVISTPQFVSVILPPTAALAFAQAQASRGVEPAA